MTIDKWFDPYNAENCRAWKRYRQTGVLTDNFRGLTRPDGWERRIADKIADCWAEWRIQRASTAREVQLLEDLTGGLLT